MDGRRPAGYVGGVISVRVVSPDGRLEVGGLDLLDREGIKWVDVVAPTLEELEPLIARYGLHPLAVEDALHLDQRPKLEEYPGHVFIVVQSFKHGEEPADLTVIEQHMFLGSDWLITVHEVPNVAIDSAIKRVSTDPKSIAQRGADFLAYAVADGLVDQNFPIVDALTNALDELEDHIFDGAGPKELQRLFSVKRALGVLRRVLSPQRDVVGLLSRHGIPHVQERTTLYFRDVFDHLMRLLEQIDTARDLVTGAMEAYLSVVANKTNEISKQLTIFATIFLPLSFVVGYFGQNFEGIGSRPAFYVMWSALIGVPLALFWWFRRKHWI